jgi:hypothetical protein
MFVFDEHFVICAQHTRRRALGVDVKCPLLLSNFCPILSKIGMCQQVLGTFPNARFHENAFQGSRIIMYGATYMMQRLAEM